METLNGAKQMATKLEDLARSRCPLCSKQLSSEEFQKAEEALIRMNKEQFKEDLKALTKQANVEAAEKYNSVIANLNKKLQEINNNYREREAQSIENATRLLKEELQMRDIQIRRLQEKTEQLTTQLRRTQSELKGEIGEVKLFEVLSKEFPNDIFVKQSRGTSSPDIIHRVRKDNGILIDGKIIYDNKNVIAIRSQDIEKMKNYMEENKTDQAIIVARNLPKTYVKNGYFGEKDGVLLIHPDIVVEVSRLIREALIKISNLSIDIRDQEIIQAKLFAYVRGSEFRNQVQKIYFLFNELACIQDKEEKAHNTMWKERRHLYDILKSIYLSISSGIDSILGDPRSP